MMTSALANWIREYDVDGFRMDAAWGVQERRPGYWNECRRELKRIKPDLFLLAEAPATDANYFCGRFDAAYDWRGGLGRWAWEGVFDEPNKAGHRLAEAVTNGCRGYARDSIIFRFLNNNDTGKRFIERYGLGITRAAAGIEFTLDGVPLIFAGDEIGAVYVPYSDANGIAWQDRGGLMGWYRKLIAMREEMPSLRSGCTIVLESEPCSVISFVRRPAEGEPALVVVNFGQAATARIKGDNELAFLKPNGGVDIMEGQRRFEIRQTGAVTIPVEANSLRVIISSH
jgi:glycosidase